MFRCKTYFVAAVSTALICLEDEVTSDLYRAFQDPQRGFARKSVNSIHTPMMATYWGSLAIMSALLTNTNRQGRWSVFPKDTTTDSDGVGIKLATHCHHRRPKRYCDHRYISVFNFNSTMDYWAHNKGLLIYSKCNEFALCMLMLFSQLDGVSLQQFPTR